MARAFGQIKRLILALANFDCSSGYNRAPTDLCFEQVR